MSTWTGSDTATHPDPPTPNDLVLCHRQAAAALSRAVQRSRQLHRELTLLHRRWQAAIAASRAALARTAGLANRPRPCLRAGLDAVPPRLPTVLVVDPDNTGADILAAALGVYGFPTRAATCRAQAAALAGTCLPDVVFLDLRGSGLDELPVAREFRDRSNGRGPLLVALTECVTPGLVERSAAAGIDLFLLKPVVLKELVDLLCQVARRESVTGHLCN